MKQISNKVNLAERRCKGKENKITAAEARNSEYLDKLVKLDEGYYIFRQLKTSYTYLESRKNDIFAMISQRPNQVLLKLRLIRLDLSPCLT